MRTLSYILAFAFLLAGPSMAGSSDNLPAAGAFAYNSAPAVNSSSPRRCSPAKPASSHPQQKSV